MSTKISVRIPQKLRAELEQAAADANQNLSEYLQENLPELIKRGVNISFAGTSKRPMIIPRKEPFSKMADRVKDAIADAVELRVFTKYLGIDLSESKQQYPPHPYQQYPSPHPYPPQPEQKKDIKEFIMEIKALESLENKTTDPEIKEMLKELKNAQLKAIQTTKEPRQSSRDRMRELIEMMTFYKMAGQPEEASKVAEVLRTEISKMQTQLHETEKSLLTATSDFKIQNLQRQIEEIKNAPTELQQITHLSVLADKDPAIRAYMNKKLGIKEKEELTPEKLKSYIESVKVPLGDIVKGVANFIQQQRAAPAQSPPPPPKQTQLIQPTEEELASRVAPELLKQPPTQPSMTTFAEPEEEPTPSPEETSLPPEEETPPKKEPGKPKPKKEKKK